MSEKHAEAKPLAAEAKHGRLGRWLKSHKLPLVAGLAVSIALGVAITVPDNEADSEELALYRKGRISKDRLNFNDKITAWHIDLTHAWTCDGRNYPKILAEIRAEQARLMEKGDKEGVETLFNLESFVLEHRRFNDKGAECPKDASR